MEYGFVMLEFFEEWTIEKVSLLISVMILLIATARGAIALRNWNKRRKERREYDEIMKDPLEVHFYIPTIEDYEITYAKQDNDIHPLDELEIPKGIEDVVFLRIKPRINVEVREIYFGFLIREKKGKPEVFYCNPLKTSLPKEKYKDSYGHLHLIEERIFTPKEFYLRPFGIRTHDAGDYTFYLVFQVSCYEYKSVKEEKHDKIENFSLKIRVK
jgi:hypothetical protein